MTKQFRYNFESELATGIKEKKFNSRMYCAVNPIFVIVINYERKSLEKLACGKMQYQLESKSD